MDFTNLQLSCKKNGKKTFTTLKDIAGLDIERIIEENGLSGEIKLGKHIYSLRRAYNGTSENLITEEEKSLAETIPRTNTRRKRSGN